MNFDNRVGNRLSGAIKGSKLKNNTNPCAVSSLGLPFYIQSLCQKIIFSIWSRVELKITFTKAFTAADEAISTEKCAKYSHLAVHTCAWSARTGSPLMCLSPHTLLFVNISGKKSLLFYCKMCERVVPSHHSDKNIHNAFLWISVSKCATANGMDWRRFPPSRKFKHV